MSRRMSVLLLTCATALASCGRSQDEVRIAQLEAELAEFRAIEQTITDAAQDMARMEAELAELREAVQSRQPAPVSHAADLVDDRHRHGDGDHRPRTDHNGHRAQAAHESPPADAHHGRQSRAANGAPPVSTEVRPTGTVIGEVRTIDDSGGRHIKIHVLAPGEEKPREYYVHNKPDLLAAVRTAKVGDIVEVGWVQTNHGPAIEAFEVIE